MTEAIVESSLLNKSLSEGKVEDENFSVDKVEHDSKLTQSADKTENVENGPDKNEEKEFKGISNEPNQLDDVTICRESRNRVKLYVLCEQRVWDDRGTGHVACIQTPGQQSFVIVVKLESTEKNVLESKILLDTVYQKQQETLIVWSESDSCDLALSFQEKSGCEEIWAKICEVQGRDPGDTDAAFDEMEEADLSEGSGTGGKVVMPAVEMGRLGEIDLLISNHMATASLRDKMSTIIENEGVIPKLVDVFRMCEDIENTEGLRTLYSIAKNTILLNRANIQDVIFEDVHLKDFIGMLEYDPAHEEPRKHREFLYEKAKFREVLTIGNDEIREKIHKVYRVQYLQDVCLPAPSLFEENLMGTMNSYLFFLRVDICTALQKDKRFMRELFDQLKSPDTPVPRRRDLALFLREFLNLSQSFPANGCNQKDIIIKGLFGADILSTIEPCIVSKDEVTRVTIVELVALLVEHNPQLTRDFLLKQAKDKSDEEVLLNRLIIHMLNDSDPELSSAIQVSNILRTLLDPDNMVSVQKAERSEFLHLFYQRSIYTLVKPMIDNVVGGKIRKDDYCSANKQSLVVRLLCFCIEHHSFSMRQHCISSDLLNKVLVLLGSRHHFLALCALKMLRTVLGVKDEFYNRYIIREKVLDRVVVCFQRNGPRYNLLNSAMLELFEYIRTDDVKSLIKYVVENHIEAFADVDYVKVFVDLKTKYEQIRDREMNSGQVKKEEQRAASPPSYAKERQEEQWFDEEEDVTTEVKKELKSESPRKSGSEPSFPSVLRRKNAIDEDDGSPVFSGTIGPVQPAEKKIVIKMGDRSRTPSPSTSPSLSPVRDDEVTSSQNNSKENSPAPSVKSLVDYGDSDSDSDDQDDLPLPGPSTVVPSDSVPTSSTGSPNPPEEGVGEVSATSPSAENGPPTKEDDVTGETEDDVTSTSGDETTTTHLGRKRASTETAADGRDAAVKRSRTEEGPATEGTEGKADHDGKTAAVKE